MATDCDVIQIVRQEHEVRFALPPAGGATRGWDDEKGAPLSE
jgi:hypothetical protein